MKRVVLVGSLLLAVAGSACSYTIVGPPFHPVTVPAESGIIYVYRADSSKGEAHAMPVFVDGVPLGWFFRAGYVPYHVKAGKHVLKVIVSSRVHEIDVQVSPNGESYVRYEVSLGDTTLVPMSPSDGRSQIAECHLLPGGYDGRDRI